MIDISEFLISHKQNLNNINLKSLFKENLSDYEVSKLSIYIDKKYIICKEPIHNLYSYTYHNVNHSPFKPILRLQCTSTCAYVQFQEEMPYISLSNDTILYYYDSRLYVVKNRIVKAFGTISTGTIHWHNKITFDDCYMNLPQYTIPVDNNQIIPSIILNSFT